MNSDEIRKLCSELCHEIEIVDRIAIDYPIFLLSGRSVFLSTHIIETVSNCSEKGSLYTTKKRNIIDFLNFMRIYLFIWM